MTKEVFEENMIIMFLLMIISATLAAIMLAPFEFINEVIPLVFRRWLALLGFLGYFVNFICMYVYSVKYLNNLDKDNEEG
jgi:drug/metabolite transporter (DMT)-like permease